MPEGPEIRREANAIGRVLAGARLSIADYRIRGVADRAASLTGRRLVGATSRGKALLITYDNGLTHYSHNQLYGAWFVLARDSLPRFEAARGASIRVVLAACAKAAVLLSATAIELLRRDELDVHPYLARLGPDVLDPAVSKAQVAARFASPRFARRSLGALLLDQSFLAGLGNYLRSEILHVAGLRERVRPIELDARQLAKLASATLALPRQSLRAGGITNHLARARALAREGLDFESRRFRAYGREGLACWQCGARIRRIEAGSRGVFYCPRCQRV